MSLYCIYVHIIISGIIGIATYTTSTDILYHSKHHFLKRNRKSSERREKYVNNKKLNSIEIHTLRSKEISSMSH